MKEFWHVFRSEVDLRMSSPVLAPKPPSVTGTRNPVRGDAFRLAWWSLRGLRHRMGQTGHDRWTALVLAVLWWPTWPAQVLARLALLNDPYRCYYFASHGDAVIAIVRTPHGWRITDHLSSRPGSQAGGRLRSVVGPTLMRAADREGILIYGLPANARLASWYASQHAYDGAELDVLRGHLCVRRMPCRPSHDERP